LDTLSKYFSFYSIEIININEFSSQICWLSKKEWSDKLRKKMILVQKVLKDPYHAW